MEFLKDILGAQLFNQVKQILDSNNKVCLANVADGSYIPRKKFNDLLKQNKMLKVQLDQQIKRKKCVVAKYENRLNYLVKELAITQAIATKRAINPNIVRRLLNENEIILENNKVVGLNEQLNALAINEPYLFKM